jgi:hypothetical protein
MARPRAEDEGDGLEIWRAAVTMLKIVADSRQGVLLPSLMVRWMVTTSRCKIQHVTKCYRRPWTWTDSLEGHKKRKMDMRFGI